VVCGEKVFMGYCLTCASAEQTDVKLNDDDDMQYVFHAFGNGAEAPRGSLWLNTNTPATYVRDETEVLA